MPGAPYRNRKHPKSLDFPALHSGIASFGTVKRVDIEVEEELDGKSEGADWSFYSGLAPQVATFVSHCIHPLAAAPAPTNRSCGTSKQNSSVCTSQGTNE